MNMTDDQIETLLLNQTIHLDKVFGEFMLQAFSSGDFNQNRLSQALRAQAQCRATAHTLQQWQNQMKDQKPGDAS